jgi:hypothetical protein
MKRLTAEWVSQAEADYQGAVTLQRHKNQIKLRAICVSFIVQCDQ